MSPVQVQTHSGYKADEYPVGFTLEGVDREVIEIEDRWYGPGYSYFRVFADDARRYLLRQHLDSAEWYGEAVRAPDRPR